jgi:hypothetical protein
VRLALVTNRYVDPCRGNTAVMKTAGAVTVEGTGFPSLSSSRVPSGFHGIESREPLARRSIEANYFRVVA